MKYLPGLVKRYNGTVTRLFFDEGGEVEGRASPRAPNSAAPAEFEASLAKPFYSRPGHWGVFFVTCFDVGPAFWPLMEASPFTHPVLVRHVRADGPGTAWHGGLNGGRPLGRGRAGGGGAGRAAGRGGARGGGRASYGKGRGVS